MLIFQKQGVINDIPMHTAAMSRYPFSHGVKALYTFKTAFGEEVCGAIQEGNTLLVPRESVPYATPPYDFRVSYPVKAVPCTFTPRHNQSELCEKSIKLLLAGQNHVFDASTGFGKSVCGSYIAARLGQPTLIIVTKQDLLDQWENTLIKLLKIPPSLVGRIQQDTCKWEGKQFVIGMAHSLIITGRYPEEMYRYFGMVIWDEVHTMATDCFIRACQLFPAKYRLGFSATPDRKDGKTRLLHWHIGPTLVKGTVVALPPKILVVNTGWRIPTRRKLIGNSWEHVPIPHAPGRMMGVYKAQADSPQRNSILVNFAVQAYHAGRRTVVLTDLTDHLDKLFHLLCSAGVCGSEIGYYVGSMTKEALEASKKRKLVLATYKMCSTGTDVPDWDTLILASPRADVKQSIGRVMREKEGKLTPVILDPVDADPLFKNFHQSRLKQYRAVGATVVQMTN